MVAGITPDADAELTAPTPVELTVATAALVTGTTAATDAELELDSVAIAIVVFLGIAIPVPALIVVPTNVAGRVADTEPLVEMLGLTTTGARGVAAVVADDEVAEELEDEAGAVAARIWKGPK